MNQGVVQPWLAELFRGAKLDWQVRFASDAEAADTSCSEPASDSQLDGLVAFDSAPVLVTGAAAVSEYASVLSHTASGLPWTELAAQAKPVARSA